MTEDLLAMILVRLPTKSITTFKLVCKRWKSILESPFLRKLFLSQHQNSHSLWSLMGKEDHSIETVAHYGCKTWGHDPPRSLGSYIFTLMTKTFRNHKEKYRGAEVVAYTDVGLILIRVVSVLRNVSLFVANPVSREFVETDPPWCEDNNYFWNLGIATRTESNGVLLGYKVVLLYDAYTRKKSFLLLIYSSETGLWSHETVQFPFSFFYQEFRNSISLNGNLHWLACNDVNDEVVVSVGFYDMGSDNLGCHVTPFPDLDKSPRFKRACTTSQGNLMYMNIVHEGKEQEQEYKLSVWLLKSSWEWQLVSEVSLKNGFYTIPLAINPIDAETVYLWSINSQCLLSMNLRTGKFVLHDKLIERSSDGCILKSAKRGDVENFEKEFNFSVFLLPQWLHRIPKTVTRV